MRELKFLLILLVILSCAKKKNETTGGKELSGKMVRKPAVSGQWYPSSRESLYNMVRGFLDNATIKEKYTGDLVGIIAPHAGFVYSGWVAAYAYKYLESKKGDFKGRTFILVGSSHYVDFQGVALYPDGEFETPLGSVVVDKEIADKLVKETTLIRVYEKPHLPEHSLEAQLPFLQVALDGSFKIVPLLFGRASLDDALLLGEILAKAVREKGAVIVASTDMSHYHPYDVAVAMDTNTARATCQLDINELVNGLEEGKMELCGYFPVLALMRAASLLGAKNGILLKYANSGDVPYGSKDRVVGYYSVLFLTEEKVAETREREKKFDLTFEQKKYLLLLARRVIEEYVRTGKKPEIEPPDDPVLREDGAVFVTIHRHGALRGCIGQMMPQGPLYRSVVDMAISAATRDYRFPPVKPDELKEIDIEISVLSPLSKIDDWRKIKLGEHGVYLKKGYNSGVFLPQVGRMPGFTLESFLAELCEQKAGLPRDCYKDPSTEIYVFTVLEFDESLLKQNR